MAAPVNRFKQSLKEGRQTIGCWLTQGTAIAAEIAATADFDWLLIDTEHSPNNLPSVLAQLQAIAGYDASAAVRPHVGETHVIKQILDMGCQTLIVPMVESGEQAEMLVRSMRYPPAGIRGVGGAGARATGFSSHADYLTTADREMCLVVQIETPAGVAALDDILAVEGVDAVFIGPSDLSANYGHIGNPGAPEVVEAVQSAGARVRRAARRRPALLRGGQSGIRAHAWSPRRVVQILADEDELVAALLVEGPRVVEVALEDHVHGVVHVLAVVARDGEYALHPVDVGALRLDERAHPRVEALEVDGAVHGDADAWHGTPAACF